jgi:hypothetical protein
MKKYFALTFILLNFTSYSFAQMQLGIKAGINFSTINGDDVDELDSKIGFAGGLFFMYQFNSLFAIQPEVYYSMKGATADDLVIENSTSTLCLDYIEVPILFKVIIPVEGSSVKPSIFVGPSVGFNTTAKAMFEYDGESSEDDIEDVSPTDLGLVFGAGLGFPVGMNELGFDLRYILGLSSIDDSEDEFDVKNSVININAYFGFNLH